MSAANLSADARTLGRLIRGLPQRGQHAERLQAFYAPQAERYDAFRERLLHGREDLIERLAIGDGMRVVELGCGTGSSIDRIGHQVSRCASIQLVDCCQALLAVAKRRTEGHANVEVIEADAEHWRPKKLVDCVFLSYALTMIPNWQAVLANAVAMLNPGGQLGVVDFHLPASAGKLSKLFWRRWFAHDGVRLSTEHIPALHSLLPGAWSEERHAPVPYVPGVEAPYYLFVGNKG